MKCQTIKMPPQVKVLNDFFIYLIPIGRKLESPFQHYDDRASHDLFCLIYHVVSLLFFYFFGKNTILVPTF